MNIPKAPHRPINYDAPDSANSIATFVLLVRGAAQNCHKEHLLFRMTELGAWMANNPKRMMLTKEESDAYSKIIEDLKTQLETDLEPIGKRVMDWIVEYQKS